MGAPEKVAAAAVLTAEQVVDYRRDGFVSVDALTSAAEVVALQGIYDRLFEPGAVIDEQDRIELAGDRDAERTLPQILNPDRYAPELRETAAYRNAKALAGQLLADDAEAMGMHAIRKPPRSGAPTPWHQDEAYWDPRYEHRALSIWMPLQPATLDNGCMHFVPGSHHEDVRVHELINPDSADGLQVPDQDGVEGGVACPLAPGGATVHAGRTLHYAGPNRTDEPRRALIMAFRAPPRWIGEIREFPWQPAAWYA